jgi:biopolymer transport protein ExbB/TolQ
MVVAGLLVTVLGFGASLLSLRLPLSTGARLAMVLAGIAVSLAGIIGLLNPAYVKNAIWKK